MITVRLNTDKEYVKAIRKALEKNDGYCPCAVTKTDDTKCMCKDFRDQIDKHISGECHCRLYVIETDEE